MVHIIAKPRVYLEIGDTVHSCYCKFRLMTPPWWGLTGQRFLILTTLDRWKRHFREQNYIENISLLKRRKIFVILNKVCVSFLPYMYILHISVYAIIDLQICIYIIYIYTYLA